MMLRTSRRRQRRREAAARRRRRRRGKVCASGGRGRGHLALRARLFRSWLVLLLCGAQWSFYPKIRDGCFNGGEILSIHRVVLSLCVVVSPPRATKKRVLSSGLDVVYVVKGAAKKSRLQQKTVVKVVVVGRRRVRAHLGVLLCVSFFLSLFRVSDRVVVVPSAVFSEEKRAFVRWCWWC